MSSGLIALLDDVAAIAKVAAVTVDDVALQTAKAGAKSAGVVIDDAAVTPRYVVGFAAERELPIVYSIAKGSLKNKLLFLLPAALLLTAFAPFLITPMLMLGGLYLCYEGAEKVLETVLHLDGHDGDVDPAAAVDPATLEASKVAGAIRTDFILSAEIMAIALATLTKSDLLTQALVLFAVGTGITVGVYGAVALIVKADDVGLAMSRLEIGTPLGALLRASGRGLVHFMPYFLKALTVVGTAAMLWVGGGIIVHALEGYGLDTVGHAIHDVAASLARSVGQVIGALEWTFGAIGAGLFGLLLGGTLVVVSHFLIAPVIKRIRYSS